jgi:hypothetical protein
MTSGHCVHGPSYPSLQLMTAAKRCARYRFDATTPGTDIYMDETPNGYAEFHLLGAPDVSIALQSDRIFRCNGRSLCDSGLMFHVT